MSHMSHTMTVWLTNPDINSSLSLSIIYTLCLITQIVINQRKKIQQQLRNRPTIFSTHCLLSRLTVVLTIKPTHIWQRVTFKCLLFSRMWWKSLHSFLSISHSFLFSNFCNPNSFKFRMKNFEVFDYQMEANFQFKTYESAV